jgi:MFS family permease
MNFKMFFALMTGLSLGVTFLNIPPGMTLLMNLYGVTYTGISILMSALLWSHALLQIPAGVVTDRLGIGKSLMFGVTLMSLGTLGPAASPEFTLALICRVIAGIGTSLCFATVMKMIAVYAPDGRVGTYQSFFAGFFSVGNIMSYLLIPKLIPLGWQWVYLVPGTLSLSLLPLSLGLHMRPQSPASLSLISLPRIFKIRAGWVLGFYHAISWGAMLSLGNWIPTLLAEFRPESTPLQLAWGGVLVMFISGLGRIFGGFILLRQPPLRIANGSILILAVLFLGLFSVHQSALLLFLAFLAAWFSSVNFGAFFHLASKTVRSESLATLFGFVNFLANLGAVLFTLAFGFAKDATGSLSWGFGLLSIAALLALFSGRGILKRDCTVDSLHPEHSPQGLDAPKALFSGR